MHTQLHPLIDYLPRDDRHTAFAARVRVYTAAICGDAGVADVLLTGVPREQHDAVERLAAEVSK